MPDPQCHLCENPDPSSDDLYRREEDDEIYCYEHIADELIQNHLFFGYIKLIEDEEEDK